MKISVNLNKIIEMASTRDVLVQNVLGQSPKIVGWWGFLQYISHYSDVNNLTNHEKEQILSAISVIQRQKLKNSSPTACNDIKNDVLRIVWGDGTDTIEGLEYLTDPDAVAIPIMGKLYAESVYESDDVYQQLVEDFMAEEENLIRLIAYGTPKDTQEYLDQHFPSSVMPQKKKRGVKHRRNGK